MRSSQDRKSVLKFQQFFEDQDINLDDYIYQQVPNKKPVPQGNQNKYNQNDQIPIQLVKNNKDGEFAVNMAAIDLINSYDQPVALVCLAGKYRTGKSFLLNKLMKLKGRGFKVSSATSACTEGIWMWSKPIYNQKENCLMFIIDTQGSQATNRNANHDAKIFTIAILISSYFIYNSVGAIDERSINELNLVATLCKGIISKGDISQESISRYMPKFMWLLRDFILEVQNQYGRQISPTDYLQNCLDPKKGSQQTRNTKKILTKVFRQRDCMMFIRPTQQENNIHKLDELPDSSLRPQFLQSVNKLRNKILSNASPKIIDGQPITTKMLSSMIISYVDSINKGAIPNIISAWDHIGEQAALEAYDAGMQAYNQKFDRYFSTDKSKEDDQLNRILKQMRDAALDAYDYNIQTPNQKMRIKLKAFIDDKQKTITLINEQFNEAHNIKILTEYSQTLVENVEQGKYSSQNPQILNQDLKYMISQYNANAQGSKKCQILTLFLTNFNAMIFKSYNDSSKQRYNALNYHNQEDKLMREEYQQRIKIYEDRLNSAKQQIETKEARAGRQLQDERKRVQEAQNQAISLRQQIQAMNKKNMKKKCCFF